MCWEGQREDKTAFECVFFSHLLLWHSCNSTLPLFFKYINIKYTCSGSEVDKEQKNMSVLAVHCSSPRGDVIL